MKYSRLFSHYDTKAAARAKRLRSPGGCRQGGGPRGGAQRDRQGPLPQAATWLSFDIERRDLGVGYWCSYQFQVRI